MLRHLELAQAAQAVEKAVEDVLAEGRSLTPDLGGDGTTQGVTELVMRRL